MARRRIDTTVDVSKILRELRSKRSSLARTVARELVVRNVARDESARNPEHRIYYFDAVDKGRAAITAGEEIQDEEDVDPKDAPKLHFKVSPRKWIVTQSVGPAPPRRITDLARRRIPARLEAVASEFFGSLGRIPTGNDMARFRKRLSKEIIKTYKEATIEQTETRRTKKRYYGVASIPLADAFEIVEE